MKNAIEIDNGSVITIIGREEYEIVADVENIAVAQKTYM